MSVRAKGFPVPPEADVAESVDDAIASRRSVRAFLPTPVPRDLVEHILEVSARAPSGTNTQPWKVYAVAGAPQKALIADLLAAHDDPAQQAKREYEYYPTQWFEPYLGRRRKVGWDMYGLLGIAKGDKAAMHRQHGENYTFFGAPAGLFFTVDRRLETGSWLDCGMFIENVMIAARGHGLHTCPQAALANFPAIVRRHLSIPEDEIVICGMALGYEDKSARINELTTEREPVSGFARFLGW
ncbi:nitroreductase [Futiania mangrovi]|uniref:Nitroreductase n=1 Tax=Futiania mangrovi TaxID=2959716 RepID=A0A9J6PEU7_9PROT|nr:nitroreductase [Futiania mangrovii]MCP1336958.1 nitroreductase [Futiania mangrovii]